MVLIKVWNPHWCGCIDVTTYTHKTLSHRTPECFYVIRMSIGAEEGKKSFHVYEIFHLELQIRVWWNKLF